MPTELPFRAAARPLVQKDREVRFLLLQLAVVLLGLFLSLDFSEYGPHLHNAVQGYLMLGI